MIIEKSYKLPFYPTTEQITQINKEFGAKRWMYNFSLSYKKSLFNTGTITVFKDEKDNKIITDLVDKLISENPKKFTILKDPYITARKLGILITELKKITEFKWLAQPTATNLSITSDNLDNAFERFKSKKKSLANAKYPKYKSKWVTNQSYTLTTSDNPNFKNNFIYNKLCKLPKLGKCNIQWDKVPEFNGLPTMVTISRDTVGNYWVSFMIKKDIEITEREPMLVGIDLGIKDLLILSDGTRFKNLKTLNTHAVRLARAQRSLSRKIKGSNNYKKQKLKVAKIHKRIANIRNSYLHRITKYIANKYTHICIENLNIKGMMKNSRLAKAIADAAWGELIRQLVYKARWLGGKVTEIGRFFASSQLCNSCNSCNTKNPEVKDLSVRHWTCNCCGTKHDRDINAAINILIEGMRIDRCGVAP